MRVHAVSDLHADYAQNLQWYSPCPATPPLTTGRPMHGAP